MLLGLQKNKQTKKKERVLLQAPAGPKPQESRALQPLPTMGYSEAGTFPRCERLLCCLSYWEGLHVLPWSAGEGIGRKKWRGKELSEEGPGRRSQRPLNTWQSYGCLKVNANCTKFQVQGTKRTSGNLDFLLQSTEFLHFGQFFNPHPKLTGANRSAHGAPVWAGPYPSSSDKRMALCASF